MLPKYATGQSWMIGPVSPWMTTAEAEYAGYAVLAAWTPLLLAGEWRLRTGWIDRLGVALGALWALTTLDAIHHHLMYRVSDLLRSLKALVRW